MVHLCFGLLESFAGVAEVDVVECGAGYFDGRNLYAGGFEGDEHGRHGGGSVFGAGVDGFGGDLDVAEDGDVLESGVDSFGGGGLGEFDVDRIAAEFAFEGFGGSFGDDVAAIDDGDVLGELIGLFQVVGGEQDGQAFGGEVADFIPEFGAGFGVEASGGFVEKEDLGAMDDAHGDIEFAFHATGISAGDAGGGSGEGEAIEQSVDARFQIGAVQTVELALESKIFAAGAAFIDTGFLRDAADGAADALGVTEDVDAGDFGFTRIGAGERGEDFDGGGFACAVGAEQSEDGAAGDGEVEAVERFDAIAIGLGEIAHFDGERRCWGGRQFFECSENGVW